MALASTLEYIKELSRQAVADDGDFWQKYTYFFELIVPAEVSNTGETQFLFPLILPPNAYQLSEPFSAEESETQGAGLIVEENGIIKRMITISGNTGFKPRPLKVAWMQASPAYLPPDKKSYSRMLPTKVPANISGQRHFQYLQDSVFRTYADLKRDPTYAKETKLIFHNPKDREHWWVVPKNFTLTRDVSSKLLYNYEITLLVVDKADEEYDNFSEDKALFDQIKDTMRTVKKATDIVSGAYNDLTNLVNEIRLVVQNIDTILSGVSNIVTAMENFRDGVTNLINVPYDWVTTSISEFETASYKIHTWLEYGELTDDAKDFPDDVRQKFLKIINGLCLVGSDPSNFETPLDKAIKEVKDLQEARKSISNTRYQEALDGTYPTTFDEVRALGTSITPGEAITAQGQETIGGEVLKYKSVKQVPIGANDTLASLAAKYMGDVRKWQYIAIANGLKPPFIDAQASTPLVNAVSEGSQITGLASGADESPFNSSLGTGHKIKIPNNLRSTSELPMLPVTGVRLEEKLEDHILGTDFYLIGDTNAANTSRMLYDIPIDTEKGSVDAKLISGLDNLKQFVIIRLITERGTDQLYKKLGLRRIIGLNFVPLDLESSKFRLIESLATDPRIVAVNNLTIEQNLDSLSMDMDVVIRGLSETKSITTTI